MYTVRIERVIGKKRKVVAFSIPDVIAEDPKHMLAYFAKAVGKIKGIDNGTRKGME